MQADEGERLVAVDFDEGQILLRIAGNITRLVAFVVVRDDLDFQIRSAFDHVLIGHDETGRIDQESGAETLQGLANLARTAAVSAEKLRGEIIERIAHLAPHDTLRVDVDHRGQDLRHRLHRGLGGGVGLAESVAASNKASGRKPEHASRENSGERTRLACRSVRPRALPMCGRRVRTTKFSARAPKTAREARALPGGGRDPRDGKFCHFR